MTLLNKLAAIVVVSNFCVLPLTANAQSYDFSSTHFNQDREARLSIKIPFGTQRTDTKAQPRLSFSVRHYETNNGVGKSWILKNDNTVSQLGFIENEVAISLSASPQFSLNGETIYFTNPEDVALNDDVKTAGKFALGAGLVTLATAVVVVGVYAIQYDGDGT